MKTNPPKEPKEDVVDVVVNPLNHEKSDPSFSQEDPKEEENQGHISSSLISTSSKNNIFSTIMAASLFEFEEEDPIIVTKAKPRPNGPALLDVASSADSSEAFEDAKGTMNGYDGVVLVHGASTEYENAEDASSSSSSTSSALSPTTTPDSHQQTSLDVDSDVVEVWI
jgi:hypothetical protein